MVRRLSQKRPVGFQPIGVARQVDCSRDVALEVPIRGLRPVCLLFAARTSSLGLAYGFGLQGLLADSLSRHSLAPRSGRRSSE